MKDLERFRQTQHSMASRVSRTKYVVPAACSVTNVQSTDIVACGKGGLGSGPGPRKRAQRRKWVYPSYVRSQQAKREYRKEARNERHHQRLMNLGFHECNICQQIILRRPLVDDLKEVQCRKPCSAFFHKVCAETWLKGVSSCPTCRINPMFENGAIEAPEAAAFRNATNQIWEGDDTDGSDTYDEDDDVFVSDANGGGGAARYPDFRSSDEESLEYWSELGYHWDRFVSAWVNDEGRTPAQEDPREYYTEPPDRSMHISQYDGTESTDNHAYWMENGFEFNRSRGAWVFSHGELQGLLPSEVSSFWGSLYRQAEDYWEKTAEIMAIYLRSPDINVDSEQKLFLELLKEALKIYKASQEPIIVLTDDFGTFKFPRQFLQSIISNDETNTVKEWFDSL